MDDDAAYEESGDEQEDNASSGSGGGFSPIQCEQGGADSIPNGGGADSIQNGGVGEFDEILVESAINYTFPERVRFFLGGNSITNDNRQAVEYCIIGEAGVKVTKNNTCKKMELKEKIVEEYVNVIRSLDPSLFQSSKLRNDMYRRLAGGRMDKYGSKIMWRLSEEFQSKMKKLLTGLPINYHKMASGNQLYDVYNKVVRDHWKFAYVSEYCSVMHWNYMLTSLLLFFLSSPMNQKTSLMRRLMI